MRIKLPSLPTLLIRGVMAILLVLGTLSLIQLIKDSFNLGTLDKRTLAGLHITTNDVRSTIYLDGIRLGETPLKRQDLQPGIKTIRIEPIDQNYASYETQVKLSAGLFTTIAWIPNTRPELSGGVIYELEKISGKGKAELSIASIPDGAIIKVNDGNPEFSPVLKTDLTGGTYDITASLASYGEQKHTLNVIDGYRLSILFKMARMDQSAPEQSSENSGNDEHKPDTSADTPATSAGTPIRTANTESALQSTASATRPQSNNSEIVTNSESANVSAPNQLVTILPTNFFHQGTEVVRVRSQAGTGGAEIGFAQVGKKYPYLHETKAGWIKINFSGKIGWVSASFATLEE